MKKIRTKRGLLGTLMIAAILGTGCNTEQSVPELYVDDNIRETPVTAFTENIEVSKAIEERCKAVLNQDGNTNIAVYCGLLCSGGIIIPGASFEAPGFRKCG